MTRPRTEVKRAPLALTADPHEVIWRLRSQPGLVVLSGAWHVGHVVIGFDPVRRSVNPKDIDDTGSHWGWLGVFNFDGSAELGLYRHVLIHTAGRWWVESMGTPDPDVLAQWEELVAEPTETGDLQSCEFGEFVFVPGAGEHQAAVARAVEHIAAGDIFQVNLCARYEATWTGDPVAAFLAGLERLQPQYAAFVRLPGDDRAIASFSPELFLRRTGREVLTSPIKGTAPLSVPAHELEGSAKNRAENVMIVDLMRNDLGRVAQPGSVRVPSLVRLERHAVWHLVSDVVAHLEADVTDAALLTATFPPGSVTGAPKVRALEIADALESSPRIAYTGAIGHAGPDTGLELNVVIRTLEFESDRVWLGVGGGIVIDSDPESEFTECLVKARPIIEAIGGRLAGDDPDPVAPVDEATAEPARSVVAPIHVDAERGIFETVLVRDGVPLNLEAHVARLDASVRSVFGTTVRTGLERAVRASASQLVGEHRLRIDAAPTRGDVKVSLTSTPLAPEPGPWRLRMFELAGGLGEHKWADRSALPTDGHEALLIDTDGSVLETARASVLIVLDDGIHTPPLDGRILPGTTRARIIETAAELGIPVIQRRLALADLVVASEVFVVNALRGVVPVAGVEGVAEFSLHVVAGRLEQALASETVVPVASAAPSGTRLLVVDNYDSFVHNLVQYARELGAEATVIRNDDPVPDPAEFTHALISPGPGTPAEAGISAEVVRRFGEHMPVLGVCLGHQVMAELLGGRVVRADSIGEAVVHGKPSLVHHDGRGIWSGLPQPATAARYHSLVVTDLPDSVQISARTAGGAIMGLRSGRLEGIQAHPESILTSQGHAMIANFLASGAGD